MRYGKFDWSYLTLRVGLGIVFLWIGVDIWRHPEAWIGFLPASLPFGLSRSLTLQLNGIFDIVVGIMLFLGRWQKITAGLAVLHLVGIIFTQGVDAVLIRDVGLLGAALSLLLRPTRTSRY